MVRDVGRMKETGSIPKKLILYRYGKWRKKIKRIFEKSLGESDDFFKRKQKNILMRSQNAKRS